MATTPSVLATSSQDDARGRAGVEVQRQEGQEGDTDFSAQVNNIKAFGPDAVIFTGYHREAGLLFKQLNEAGVEAIQMGGDGIKSDEIADEAGGAENVEGAFCTFGGFAQEQMPGYEEFAARFEEATGKAAGPYAENNYDGLGALVAAMVEAQLDRGCGHHRRAARPSSSRASRATLTFDEKGDVSVPGGGGTGADSALRVHGRHLDLHGDGVVHQTVSRAPECRRFS